MSTEKWSVSLLYLHWKLVSIKVHNNNPFHMIYRFNLYILSHFVLLKWNWPILNRSPEQLISIWHKRLAHAAIPVVRETLKLHKPEFSFPSNFLFPFCEICVRAKLTTKPFDPVRTLPIRPAQIIAADLIAPINPRTTPHGYRFLLTMIDVYSQSARVFLLKSKTETVGHIKTFLHVARAQHPNPRQLKFFRSDNGTEFTNRKV